jgi:hypothetical protein
MEKFEMSTPAYLLCGEFCIRGKTGDILLDILSAL